MGLKTERFLSARAERERGVGKNLEPPVGATAGVHALAFRLPVAPPSLAADRARIAKGLWASWSGGGLKVDSLRNMK